MSAIALFSGAGPVAGFGFAFGFANAIQSRVTNNGTRRRFPDWLLWCAVLVVSAIFALAARAIAHSSGASTALAYGFGQAFGVVFGARIANAPLYDRLPPDGRGAHER
jgi:hypothetical protein